MDRVIDPDGIVLEPLPQSRSRRRMLHNFFFLPLLFNELISRSTATTKKEIFFFSIGLKMYMYIDRCNINVEEKKKREKATPQWLVRASLKKIPIKVEGRKIYLYLKKNPGPGKKKEAEEKFFVFSSSSSAMGPHVRSVSCDKVERRGRDSKLVGWRRRQTIHRKSVEYIKEKGGGGGGDAHSCHT